MTVPVQIPVVDSHVAAQQALDQLAALFPLNPAYVGSGIEVVSHKGSASGYAGLDANSLVPVANLPYKRGTGSCSWAGASVDSAQTTVAHGLGATPTIVLLGQVNAGGFGHRVAFVENAATDGTNIYVAGTSVDGTPAVGSASFYWMAFR